MAVTPRDAVAERGKRLLVWTAAAVLCIGIAVMAAAALRLIKGFLAGFAGLLRRMLF